MAPTTTSPQQGGVTVRHRWPAVSPPTARGPRLAPGYRDPLRPQRHRRQTTTSSPSDLQLPRPRQQAVVVTQAVVLAAARALLRSSGPSPSFFPSPRRRSTRTPWDASRRMETRYWASVPRPLQLLPSPYTYFLVSLTNPLYFLPACLTAFRFACRLSPVGAHVSAHDQHPRVL